MYYKIQTVAQRRHLVGFVTAQVVAAAAHKMLKRIEPAELALAVIHSERCASEDSIRFDEFVHVDDLIEESLHDVFEVDDLPANAPYQQVLWQIQSAAKPALLDMLKACNKTF